MRLVLLFAALAAMTRAETIHFVGVPTGVNDGVYYVTPYEVTVNGVPQLVTCYDVFDDVNFGDTWDANIFTLEQAADHGYFAGSVSGYKKVAWLDAQNYTSNAEQVGLQHAIWNVFGTSPNFTAETLGYETAANTAAANAYAGFDFSRVRFIEQVGGVVGRPGTEQAFVFMQTPASPAVPEPGTLVLLLSGTVAGIAFCYKKRFRWD